MSELTSQPAGYPPLEEEVERVMADFRSRTLDAMVGTFSRLIYIASLRDYNTGRYHHYGLENRYSDVAVDEGLRRCHREVFEALMAASLEEQTQDLIRFFESLQQNRARLVQAWQRLRSYQILPPENCHPLVRELFDRNIEAVLEVLRETALWGLLNDSHGDADDLP